MKVFFVQILSDDFSKAAFLCADRSICFHARFGAYHRTRVPAFGRDLAFAPFSADLLVVGSAPEVYRCAHQHSPAHAQLQLAATGGWSANSCTLMQASSCSQKLQNLSTTDNAKQLLIFWQCMHSCPCRRYTLCWWQAKFVGGSVSGALANTVAGRQCLWFVPCARPGGLCRRDRAFGML